MQHQFSDPQKFSSPLAPKLSMSVDDINEAYQFAQSIMQDIVAKYPEFQRNAAAARKGQQASAGQPATAPQATSQAPSIPLTPANLQQQQHALSKETQKSHQRSNSRSSHVPAAPTSAHPPPFPNPSDGIVPKYFKQTELTQEGLKLPTAKRQKQGGTSAQQMGNQTPGSTSSPQVVKPASPEVKKNVVVDAPVQEVQRSKHMCPENDCDHHYEAGFDKLEDLEKHRIEEHSKALQNPPQYLLNELGELLDVDADSKPKQKIEAAPDGIVKSGTTPAASTPVNRQGSVADTKAEKKGLMQPAVIDVLDDSLWNSASVNPMDLMHNFGLFESGANGAISDMNVYRAITPNDTPESSKSNDSQPISDISEGVGLNINIEGLMTDTWQPFGPGVSDIDDFLNVNMENNDDLNNMFNDNDYPLYNNDFKNWDEMIDPKAMEQPFVFDPNLFSFNETS